MWEIFIFSIKIMFKNKVRSFLTMLGIIVGILSLIMIVILGNSLSETFTAVTDVLYKNDQAMIMIEPTEENKSVAVSPEGETIIPDSVRLDIRDVAPILEKDVEGDSYLSIGGVLEGMGKVMNQGRSMKFYTVGSCAEEVSNSALTIIKGRDITRTDEIHAASTALISDFTADYLFNGAEPVGETLVLEYNSIYIPVVIVGVYEHIGIKNYDDPSETLTLFFVNHAYLEEKYEEALNEQYWKKWMLVVTLKNVEDKPLFKTIMEDKLNNILDQKEWKVEVSMVSEELNSTKHLIEIILRIIFVIACLSLLIGGIGIMNVMLITVTERTSEIGVRKALGATDFMIIFQFLCESFMLSFSGTFLGVVLGMAASKVIAELAAGVLQMKLNVPIHINVSLPFEMLVFSVLSSLIIGVIFGLYPAIKAVKMPVVEALRYE